MSGATAQPAQVKISEHDFTSQVIDLAHLYGWRVAHFRHAQTVNGWRTPVAADGAGFPDLVLVKLGRAVIFAELKSDHGKLSDAQQEWGMTIAAAEGGVWRVWRPSDFTEIMEILGGK